MPNSLKYLLRVEMVVISMLPIEESASRILAEGYGSIWVPERKRIVTKIEELLPLCERLK